MRSSPVRHPKAYRDANDVAIYRSHIKDAQIARSAARKGLAFPGFWRRKKSLENEILPYVWATILCIKAVWFHRTCAQLARSTPACVFGAF